RHPRVRDDLRGGHDALRDDVRAQRAEPPRRDALPAEVRVMRVPARIDVWRARTKRNDRLFELLSFAATIFGLLVLAPLVVGAIAAGRPRLSWDFLTAYPSRRPESAGIYSALVGSIWLLVLTALFAFPIGVATAVYLEEYAEPGRLQQLIEINIANLAGVP